MLAVKDEDRADAVEEHPADAPEEPQDVGVLDGLALVVPHRLRTRCHMQRRRSRRGPEAHGRMREAA